MAEFHQIFLHVACFLCLCLCVLVFAHLTDWLFGRCLVTYIVFISACRFTFVYVLVSVCLCMCPYVCKQSIVNVDLYSASRKQTSNALERSLVIWHHTMLPATRQR